jgi:linoleoyl-CoA desaturase
VAAVCARYGLPYNSKRFSRQFGSVLWRIVRMSFPDSVRPSRRGART